MSQCQTPFYRPRRIVETICRAVLPDRESPQQWEQTDLLDMERPRQREQKRFVITGMAGQGKSEIALDVANRTRAKYVGSSSNGI